MPIHAPIPAKTCRPVNTKTCRRVHKQRGRQHLFTWDEQESVIAWAWRHYPIYLAPLTPYIGSVTLLQRAAPRTPISRLPGSPRALMYRLSRVLGIKPLLRPRLR